MIMMAKFLEFPNVNGYSKWTLVKTYIDMKELKLLLLKIWL